MIWKVLFYVILAVCVAALLFGMVVTVIEDPIEIVVFVISLVLCLGIGSVLNWLWEKGEMK